MRASLRPLRVCSPCQLMVCRFSSVSYAYDGTVIFVREWPGCGNDYILHGGTRVPTIIGLKPVHKPVKNRDDDEMDEDYRSDGGREADEAEQMDEGSEPNTASENGESGGHDERTRARRSGHPGASWFPRR